MKDHEPEVIETKAGGAAANHKAKLDQEQSLSEEELEGVSGGGGINFESLPSATDASNVLKILNGTPNIKKLNKGVMGN